MTHTTLTMSTILEETKIAYTLDTRAIAPHPVLGENSKYCVYLTAQGHRCPVGRYSISPDLDAYQGSWETFNREVDAGLFPEYRDSDQCLDPKVRGKNVAFWTDLQTLHDTEPNWTPKGLSPRGQLWADMIQEKIDDTRDVFGEERPNLYAGVSRPEFESRCKKLLRKEGTS